MPILTAGQMATIVYLLLKDRKETKAGMIARAKELCYIKRKLEVDGKQYWYKLQEVQCLLSDMDEFLGKQRSLFDTDFPPEGHTRFRAEPGDSDKAALAVWKTDIGL